VCRRNRGKRREIDKSNYGYVAMTYLRYDERELIRKLDQLYPAAKVAFAAACAQRQLPCYIIFSNQTGRGDSDTLSAILERVWLDALGSKMSDEEALLELDRCMALIPEEDEEPWVIEQVYAGDAASAVAYALRTRNTGASQEAAYAARVAYEALDHHVINRLGVDGDDRVLKHALVQAELARQHRDLDELRKHAGATAEMIAHIRDRARVEAAVFFGPVS
jgi:uncharacterized protein YjaG (DUF416 family)